MKWKKWPYWLRGGIIGILVGLILLPGLNPLLKIVNIYELDKFFLLILILPMSILVSLGLCKGDFCEESLYGIIFFSLLQFFIIGAIIGWIAGKIKSKQ